MPEEVYSSHRGNSSKCPNNKKNIPLKNTQLDLNVKSEPGTSNIIVGVDKKDEDINMPLTNSQLDFKVKSKPCTQNINYAVDINDDESQTSSDQNDPIGSDSDINLSTYTNANTYVEDSFMLSWKCCQHVATCCRRHTVLLQFWPDGSVSPTFFFRCRGSLCRLEPTFTRFFGIRM
jgi:hypothetical protein